MKYFIEGVRAAILGKAAWVGEALYRGNALIQYQAGYYTTHESPAEVRKFLELFAMQPTERQ